MQSDNDEMDTDHECPVQPLIEMSQDCVVEWNESQDLFPSVSLDGTKTPLRSSSASPKSSSGRRRFRRLSIGLEEVRRKLEEQNHQIRSADRGRGSEQQQKVDSSGKATGGEEEEEVDAIFGYLQQENDGFPGISLAQAATQRTQNRQPIPTAIYPNRRAVTSLASRRRRRERERDPQSNKRTHVVEAGTNGGKPLVVCTPGCQTPPTTIQEGAFDSLLKQLMTRESSDRKIAVPSRDKENAVLIKLASSASTNPRPLAADPQDQASQELLSTMVKAADQMNDTISR